MDERKKIRKTVINLKEKTAYTLFLGGILQSGK